MEEENLVHKYVFIYIYISMHTQICMYAYIVIYNTYLKFSHLVLQFLFQGTAKEMVNKVILG